MKGTQYKGTSCNKTGMDINNARHLAVDSYARVNGFPDIESFDNLTSGIAIFCNDSKNASDFINIEVEL